MYTGQDKKQYTIKQLFFFLTLILVFNIIKLADGSRLFKEEIINNRYKYILI